MTDDLRHFTVPSFWRLHRHHMWAVIFLSCLLAASFIPNNAERQEVASAPVGTVPTTGPAVSAPNAAPQLGYTRETAPPAKSADAALDCPLLQRGQWLAGSAIHYGDKESLRVECWYGYGAQRFVL